MKSSSNKKERPFKSGGLATNSSSHTTNESDGVGKIKALEVKSTSKPGVTSNDIHETTNAVTVLSFKDQEKLPDDEIYARIITGGIFMCFLWAFASLFVQWPGLFGPNGLQPVQAWVPQAQNTVVQQIVQAFNEEFTVDDVCEVLLVLGTSLAIIATFTGFWHWWVLAVLWFAYGTLQQVGRVFLSFQWDILLLEAGLVCIALASRRARRGSMWAIRILFFKLMFMSGVVKIQSQCPTWLSLTALEYHFATQCIPTPLAWYANALSPQALAQIAVATTLIIEIPATLLILAPFRSMRAFGFLAQSMLQVFIILTGNYNFFNILTIILCVSLVSPDISMTTTPDADRDGPLQYVAYIFHKAEATFWRKVGLIVVTVFALLFYSLTYMVELVPAPEFVHWRMAPHELQKQIQIALPWILAYEAFVLVGAIALDVNDNVVQGLKPMKQLQLWPSIKSFGSLFTTLLVSTLLIFISCISAIPLVSLDQASIPALIPSSVIWGYQNLQVPFPLVHSYGLFRRMTGVGPEGQVARPEVIFEVQLEDQTWHELDFKYKPGAVDEIPPFLIPHQPRLDWQMWFAALGNYQGAPWTVHLADKILRGTPEVAHLLPSLRTLSQPPQAVRAKLFLYNFTTNLSGQNWWLRDSKSERQYLPEIRPRDQHVAKFLQAHGWRTYDHKDATISWFSVLFDKSRHWVLWLVRPELLPAFFALLILSARKGLHN